VNEAEFYFMATSILRRLNRGLGLALVCAAIQSASAFSVFGPAETWQTPTLDYVTRYYYPFPGVGDTELGGPKNYNEGSRINTPIITYGYDVSFISYFGAKGIAAVDSAMATLNALPAASSANLASFIMQGNQQINYTAQALGLRDLKSTVLSLMMEHLGLIGETHVWDLIIRDAEANTTVPCQFVYGIINRNYDPAVQYALPSPYVNGVAYGWKIWDGCPVGVSVADAVEFPVDNTSAAELTWTAVATRYTLDQEPGIYYLGLTYDDMGGLKYLYNPNNFAYEALDPSATVSTFTTSPWEGISITNAVGAGGTGTVTTTTNFVGLLGGVNKITFVKLPGDSLQGGGFTPRTFTYSMPWLTNGGVRNLQISRTVAVPDIVFSAGNLVQNNTGTVPIQYFSYVRNINFINSPANINGQGIVLPSVIAPQENITFNEITPLYIDESPSFLDSTQFIYPVLLWGSFDGTTNQPTVYPNGTGTSSLIAQLFNGSTTGSQSTTWFGLTGQTNTATTSGGTGQ
jgi:hypothetical protein